MKQSRDHRKFVKRLESERPEPPEYLMSRISSRLTPPQRGYRSGLRVALALGFTIFLVLAFALTGGIGYAANAVKGGTTAVTTLVAGPSKADKAKSATSGSNGVSTTTSTSKTNGNDTKGNGNGNNGTNGNNGNKGDKDSSSRDQYQAKVVICHRPPGNPNNMHTISVSPNAVPAHLAHGDTLGPCPNGR